MIEFLSDRQRSIMRFIENFIDDYGYPPSYEQIAEYEGIHKSAVMHHLGTLQRKGYIRRTPRTPRSIVVL